MTDAKKCYRAKWAVYQLEIIAHHDNVRDSVKFDFLYESYAL